MVAPGLPVLFCGINPGLMSAYKGQHFARPGNRFWPALHASGFTPRRYTPDEQEDVLALGFGITNLAGRATARADELTAEELVAGGRRLAGKVARYRPRWLAVLGVTAYRVAFADKRAVVGPQERTLGTTRIWVLPSPSGLNAHWTPPALAGEFGRLHAVAFAEDGGAEPWGEGAEPRGEGTAAVEPQDERATGAAAGRTRR